MPKKHKDRKSAKIRQSARGEVCTLRQDGCGRYPDSTVFCHLNTPFKGMGLKSPDLFGVYGCYHCHLLLDSGQVPKEDQLRALIETQYKLLNKGLIQI